jgi:PTS system nitrogen regulatory IIA component
MNKNNSHTPEEIMTLQEVAQYLKISERSVLRMAQRGEIPVIKIANQWRFMQTLIDDWLMSRMKNASKPPLVRMIEQSEIILPLSRLLKPEHIIFHIKPGSIESVLSQLIEPLVKSKTIIDAKKLFTYLKEREDMASTALGNGVALPHPRNPCICRITEPSVVVGICEEGTFYNSLDGSKTRLFFLVCTDSDIVHLKIMSKLAYLMKDNNTINGIIDAKNEKEVLELLNRVDMEISTND